MPQPRKYINRSEAQRVYRQTEKGKATEKKYQSSDKAKEAKRRWWQDRYGKTPSDRKQYFIDTYGEIERALKLLDKRSQFVIIHLYGLDDNKPMTQEAIAQELFLSPSRIAQIRDEALDILAPLKPQTSI